MAIKNFIQDGEGTSITAGVTKDHALKVTNLAPSIENLYIDGDLGVLTRTKIYSNYLRGPGESPDLNIDGSVTPVEFTIDAQTDRLISIYNIRFVLNSTQMSLGSAEGRRFASAAATPGLTNGLEFFIEQGGIVTDIFSAPVKQIADFLNYSDDFYNEAGALGAGMDILIARFDFPYYVNIVPTVVDRVVVRVSDDLTEINTFRIAALGTQEILTI